MSEAKTLAEMREGWIDVTEDAGKIYLGSTAIEATQNTENGQGK